MYHVPFQVWPSMRFMRFQGCATTYASLCQRVQRNTKMKWWNRDVSYLISAKPWEVKAHQRVSRSTDLAVRQLLCVRCIYQPGREIQVSLGTLTQNIRAPRRGSTGFTTGCLVKSILISERKQLKIGLVSLVAFLTAGAIDDVCLLFIYYIQFIIIIIF